MTLTTSAALAKDRINGKAKATMEHRHFATIAAIIRDSLSPADLDDWQRDRLAVCFADEMAATNPRFDRARFLRACGVEG